ncbi:hypothetical protein [Noviherbaspirillum autotrophicum]|uniref:Uncharacterized protein n=1 Tax=Noviherbaspirillum autotrophicum TaxID=709839 RepID=A0A0C2BL90_9BURK|nr:hypothetical protein [Noviherbaspirillum autotrophicum]KIF80764.1 hypothetical protein TSA66_07925 [Noviherbaspirillum autotrophicum]KIF80801.1 hypothetical protein TSA66_08170 [Noviherbaspirillum autotrophicum]KIF84026.1 hypothetical protein TSA66_00860 [Noviherbaspirillum autotrophicum]
MPDLPPPLTKEELHAIGVRNKGNKDVVRLLWEIRRYHSIVSRAHQLAHSVTPGVGALGIIAKALLNEIRGEPAVQARERLNNELFGQKVEPGDDD